MAETLFPAPTTAALTLSGYFDSQAAFKATYAKYAPVRRVACDECVASLHLAGGRGEPPRSPSPTRKVPGFDAIRLCVEHRDLWTKKDGVVKK